MTKGRRIRIRAVAGENFVTNPTADTSCVSEGWATLTLPPHDCDADTEIEITFPGLFEWFMGMQRESARRGR